MDRIHLPIDDYWKQLESWFPETKFFYYKDTDHLLNAIRGINYIPLLRPWMLMKHLEAFPELEQDALFYIDSDILVTKPIDFDALLQDDVCYLSYTGNRHISYNYIDSSHFLHKLGNVREELKQQAEEEDLLKTLLAMFQLPKERFIEAPKDTIGGAQALLKGVNAQFFQEHLQACMNVKTYLSDFNQRYMKGDTPQQKEDNGIQSWATDMFVLLFLLWKHGKQTKCPPVLDFLWSTDPVEKWDSHYIYHDAGAGPEQFQKRSGAYVNNLRTPFQDDLSWVDPRFCSIHYVAAIQKTKQLFNL